MDGCDKCGEWERGAGEVGEEEVSCVGGEGLAEHLSHKPLQISEIQIGLQTCLVNIQVSFTCITVVKHAVT